ncbi:hypothetical protein GW17_00032481 [Ensete ventricosum]|nr:hypothetical protein GW17_00032481 [Ensete ventricosum]
MAAAVQANLSRAFETLILGSRRPVHPRRWARIRCSAAASPRRSYSITLLPGDGIGPEVVSVAKDVLSLLVDSSTLKKEVAEGVDIMVVRELTGGECLICKLVTLGIYFGKPRGFGSNDRGEDIGFNTEVYSAPEVLKIKLIQFYLF